MRTSTFPWLLRSLAALLLCAPSNAQGDNGFLRGTGKLDTVISFHRDDFGETRDFGLGVTEEGEVRRELYNLYAAYGWSESIDVSANLSYLKASPDPVFDTSDEADFQDLYVQAKVRCGSWSLGEGELSVLVSPGFKIPLSNYERDGFASLGGGQIDLRGRIIAHYQPRSGAWFSAFESGYDVRNGSVADEVPYNLTLGYSGPLGTWWNVFYSQTERHGSGRSSGGAFESADSYRRWGVGCYAPLSRRLGLTASYRISDDDRPEGDIPGFSVGLVVRF